VSKELLDKLLYLRDQIIGWEGIPLEKKSARMSLPLSSADIAKQNKETQMQLQELFGRVVQFRFFLAQTVVVLSVEGASISWSAECFRFVSGMKNATKENGGALCECISSSLNVRALCGRTTLLKRSAVFLSPTWLIVVGKMAWKEMLEHPVITCQIYANPISIFMGPQSILSLTRIHTVFKEYIDVIRLYIHFCLRGLCILMSAVAAVP
jgi:hypothetical protein